MNLNKIRKPMDQLVLLLSNFRRMDHPNIVRYLGVEVDDRHQILHIFCEWYRYLPYPTSHLQMQHVPICDMIVAACSCCICVCARVS